MRVTDSVQFKDGCRVTAGCHNTPSPCYSTLFCSLELWLVFFSSNPSCNSALTFLPLTSQTFYSTPPPPPPSHSFCNSLQLAILRLFSWPSSQRCLRSHQAYLLVNQPFAGQLGESEHNRRERDVFFWLSCLVKVTPVAVKETIQTLLSHKHARAGSAISVAQ